MPGGVLRRRSKTLRETTRWYERGVSRATAGKKSRICGAFRVALGRTRTCDLLIRRGTLRLFIGPGASRLAHDDGCFAWPLILVDPSESSRIPSCRWYRRWYRRSGFYGAFCTALTHHPSSLSNVVTVTLPSPGGGELPVAGLEVLAHLFLEHLL